MLNEKEALYKEACKYYALGQPIMTDAEFDVLEQELIELGSDLPDSVSEDFDDSYEQNEVGADYLTFSIKPIKTYQEAKEYFLRHKGETFTATPKIDGVCVKNLFDVGHYLESSSRNRKSKTAIDFTEAMRAIVPKLDLTKQVTVTGEAYVLQKDLQILRDVYGKDKYVLPRSAAISLLRNPEKHREHIHLLNFKAFATSNTLSSHQEELDWLQSLGFQTPKSVVFQIDWDIDFETQVNNIMNLADDPSLPTDGIVIQVNSHEFSSEATGKYLDTQIALKLGKWGGNVFEGVVIGLEFTEAKGNKGCVLLIEPLRLPDGVTQTRINAYNPGILERLNVSVGSVVKFRRESENSCNLIY